MFVEVDMILVDLVMASLKFCLSDDHKNSIRDNRLDNSSANFELMWIEVRNGKESNLTFMYLITFTIILKFNKNSTTIDNNRTISVET